ncbi:hypothetical protein LPJ73_008650 [Coemansia sp. RSA 2703]|nr:hypothetical protein LPJ73_008650 [Coemansia sp. RSA 2703]
MDSLTGHAGAVYSLAFSQEGTLLLSGSADETVRAWDVKRSSSASEHPIIAQRREERRQQQEAEASAAGASDAMDVDNPEGAASASAAKASGSSAKTNGQSTTSGASDSKKRDAAGVWKSKRVTESDSLLKTWRTKSTPVYSLLMTKRNLAVATGAFTVE